MTSFSCKTLAPTLRANTDGYHALVYVTMRIAKAAPPFLAASQPSEAGRPRVLYGVLVRSLSEERYGEE